LININNLLEFGFRADKVKMVFYKYSHQTPEQNLRALLNEVAKDDGSLNLVETLWGNIFVDEKNPKIKNIFNGRDVINIDEFFDKIKKNDAVEEAVVDKVEDSKVVGELVQRDATVYMRKSTVYKIAILGILCLILIVIGNISLVLHYQNESKRTKYWGGEEKLSKKYQKLQEDYKILESKHKNLEIRYELEKSKKK